MDYITNATVLTTENQRKMIFSLKKAFPSLNCRLIGHSLCSRGIFSLGIGRSSDPLLIAAGFHGQEWLTCLAALRFAELLLRSRAAGKKLCGIDTRCITREVIIVPCVNPDGVQIAINGCDGAGRYSAEVSRICAASDEKWNANARGVDINHNFDAGWDILRELEIDSGHPRPRTEEIRRIYGGERTRDGSSRRSLQSSSAEDGYSAAQPGRGDLLALRRSTASRKRTDSPHTCSRIGLPPSRERRPCLPRRL